MGKGRKKREGKKEEGRRREGREGLPCQLWEEIDAYEVFICRSCGTARIAKKDVIAKFAGFKKQPPLFVSSGGRR